MKGKFYGVSVGPGDPEYMTLKAVRLLNECPVIAAPRTEKKKNIALEIAGSVVALNEKEILYLDFLMGRDQRATEARHRELAVLVAKKLDEGKNVAMLSLGDASVYATYGYLQRLLRAQGYETETIAGVTSFCACAAKLDLSLTSARLPLRIIPGDYPGLETELTAEGTKVIMKQGKGLDRVKAALKKCGLLEKARLVENCGLEGERIYHDLDQREYGYFSTIIIGE